MSVHPIFGHLFHHMGEAGLIPQQPAPNVDLDDRMACAVAEINAAHTNSLFLPSARLAESITATTS